ncbi:MAG TPA: cupin domain-containing protein [Pseudonocardiaceae bacterium]|nr:cupin domain-containing protein [Pseudonocardiaceae bacterium]
MDIRKLDRGAMKAEYGALIQRLLPWAGLNSPFEGAWSVVEPGGATAAHSHHEYEMFIATSGDAILDVDGERRPFVAGDVAYLTPGTEHQVINSTDTDFQFYSVWWDQEMADRFKARHETAG